MQGLITASQRILNVTGPAVDRLQALTACFCGLLLVGIRPGIKLRIPLKTISFTILRHQYPLRHILFAEKLSQFFS